MKKLYLIILIAFLGILLYGCADKEPTPEPDPPMDEPDAPPPPPEPEPEPTPPPVEPEPEPEPPPPPPKIAPPDKEEEPEPEPEVKKVPPPPPPPPPKEPEAETKDAGTQDVEEEKEAAAVKAEQQREVEKEEKQIAAEQRADESVEAPKAATIIAAPPEEPETAIVNLENVYFDYDKSVITDAFAEVIQANYEWISENPDIQIQLEGHCDERGTNEYNMALGEKRAQAVYDYIKSLGATEELLNKITIVSFGEERPAASGSDETAWSKNRRVEFTRM